MQATAGLSVVIPTHNRSDLIRKCIESLLKLEHRPLEILVVDDGSTDDTIECLNQFQSINDLDGIKLFVHSLPHGGAQIARNHGLSNCSQEYVYFLDSDDFVDAPGFTKFLAEAMSTDFELATGLVDKVDQNGQVLETVGRSWTPADTGQILDYDWTTNGVVYERQFLMEIGGWEVALAGSQDWELQVRSKVSAKNIVFVKQRIAFALTHAGNRVGALKFRREYTESVLIACGLNLQQLIKGSRDSMKNQLRLAGRVSMHFQELRQNGVGRNETWGRVKKHFPENRPFFWLLAKLPWMHIRKLLTRR